MEDIIAIAEEGDLPEILDIQIKAFRIVADAINQHGIPHIHQTIEDIIAEAQEYTIFKYVSNGQIAGTVRGKILENGNCYVGKLAVAPNQHNKGIGRKLMSALESHFQDCRAYELVTTIDTPNTCYLYKSLGYEVDRIGLDQYGVMLCYFIKRNNKRSNNNTKK